MADFFYIDYTIMTRYIKRGVPFRSIYDVFNDVTKTLKEKKCYLYNLDRKVLNTTMKDNIWERLNGDKKFVFTKLYDSKIKGSIEDFIGG
jgi:hypothetical protein